VPSVPEPADYARARHRLALRDTVVDIAIAGAPFNHGEVPAAAVIKLLSTASPELGALLESLVGTRMSFSELLALADKAVDLYEAGLRRTYGVAWGLEEK